MTGSSKVALEYGQINTRAEGHSEWHVRVSTGSVTGAFQTVLHSAFIGIYPKGTRCGYSEHASVILQPLPQHAWRLFAAMLCSLTCCACVSWWLYVFILLLNPLATRLATQSLKQAEWILAGENTSPSFWAGLGLQGIGTGQKQGLKGYGSRLP